MSDGFTEAMRGTYFGSKKTGTPEEIEKQKKEDQKFYYDSILKRIPIEYIQDFIKKENEDKSS